MGINVAIRMASDGMCSNESGIESKKDPHDCLSLANRNASRLNRF